MLNFLSRGNYNVHKTGGNNLYVYNHPKSVQIGQINTHKVIMNITKATSATVGFMNHDSDHMIFQNRLYITEKKVIKDKIHRHPGRNLKQLNEDDPHCCQKTADEVLQKQCHVFQAFGDAHIKSTGQLFFSNFLYPDYDWDTFTG